MVRAFRGAGRRVGDGEVVPEAPLANGLDALKVAIGIAVIAVAVALCPSHDSFEAYLAAAADHPSGFLGGLSALAERLRIAVAADTHSYLVCRTGSHRGRRFVGAFGTWVPLPSLPSLSLPDLTAGMGVCRDAEVPHELFVLICCAGFVLANLAPRFCIRHGVSSLSAVRSGRVWTLLSANAVHFSAVHLLHNLLQLLALGPVLHSALGCERMATLLLSSAVCASAASLVWNGVLGDRPHDGSVGASGVAMACIAANAALYPHVVVRFYGVEMQAAAVPLVHLAIDAFAGGGAMDVAAHVGGAACGWGLVRSWWRVRTLHNVWNF